MTVSDLFDLLSSDLVEWILICISLLKGSAWKEDTILLRSLLCLMKGERRFSLGTVGQLLSREGMKETLSRAATQMQKVNGLWQQKPWQQGPWGGRIPWEQFGIHASLKNAGWEEGRRRKTFLFSLRMKHCSVLISLVLCCAVKILQTSCSSTLTFQSGVLKHILF